MFAVTDTNEDSPAAVQPAPADPTADQVQHTHQYIQKHKINELFAHLLQLVVYHQPQDPRAFLADEVHKIRTEKVSSSLFNEKDLETMFEMIDVTAQKWITVQQLRNTCRNLATGTSGAGAGAGNGAATSLTEEQEASISSAGDAAGHVTMEKFKEVLSSLLLTRNMWSG